MIEFCMQCCVTVWGTKEISVAYTRAFKDMHDGVKTRVRTLGGDIEDFSINIGFH